MIDKHGLDRIDHQQIRRLIAVERSDDIANRGFRPPIAAVRLEGFSRRARNCTWSIDSSPVT